MKNKSKYSVLLGIALFIYNNVSGQACCTAGTPLLGSLEMTSAPQNVLQLGLTFDHNNLNDVFSQSSKLENIERQRISQSVLLEINYGITSRISLTGILTFNRQERTISENVASGNKLLASGIGDAVILTKYSLFQFSIFNPNELAIGAGIKIPTGNSSLKSNGILIPADMQPGTGSWDLFLWSFYNRRNFLINNLTLISSISYRFNGSNNRFENSEEGYSFGNEFNYNFGFSYPIISTLEFSVIGKYRNTQNDTFSNDDIPNTGGNWLNITPGLTYYLSDKFSLRVNGELPLYRNVDGTQLTTTYKTSFSIFYSFNLQKGSL